MTRDALAVSASLIRATNSAPSLFAVELVNAYHFIDMQHAIAFVRRKVIYFDINYFSAPAM